MKKSLFWLYALSASVYFGQGIEGLATLPFFFYMKETLGLDEARIMFLMAWLPLAFLVKPLWGHFIDNWNFTKKNWILLSLVGTSVLAVGLGLLPAIPVAYMIGLMVLMGVCGAVRDVANDGLMCVVGKKEKITGSIQSVQWIAVTFASVLTGFAGGYLAEHYSYKVAYLILVPVYLMIMAILFNYKAVDKMKQKKTSILETMKVLFTDKKLLIVCLFIFLYKFSPGFGTPLTFIMRDDFHWSKVFIGTLDTLSAIFSIGGAVLYYHFCKKIDMMKWLKIFVGVGAVTTLCYLYFTPITAVIYNCVFAVLGMFVLLLLLDFAARNTKPGMESTSFALLCSVANLATTCNNLTGSYLFPRVGLQWLIVIGAVSCFICFLALPLLKKEKVIC